MHERDRADGLIDAPWPPVYPKQPDEPPRVAPSRARKPDSANRRRMAPAVLGAFGTMSTEGGGQRRECRLGFLTGNPVDTPHECASSNTRS